MNFADASQSLELEVFLHTLFEHVFNVVHWDVI